MKRGPPVGYVLYWQLTALGVHCDVVAPTLIPTEAGDRVKTDRRDTEKLARSYRAGDLTPVWVPDAAHEALRDLVRTVREIVRRMDAAQPVGDVVAMTTVRARAMASVNPIALTLALFAGVTCAMAAATIFSVVSHHVVQRRRELRIRRALGAPNGQIWWAVTRQSAAWPLAGIAMGLLVSATMTRLLATFLFDVDPRELWLDVAVGLSVTVIGLLATIVPVYQAMRVDPAVSPCVSPDQAHTGPPWRLRRRNLGSSIAVAHRSGGGR